MFTVGLLGFVRLWDVLVWSLGFGPSPSGICSEVVGESAGRWEPPLSEVCVLGAARRCGRRGGDLAEEIVKIDPCIF